MRLQEIASAYATRQPKQVDYLTENAPILESIDWFATTHGLKHAYEVLTKATGGKFVGMDEPLSVANAEAVLKWAELGILGCTLEIGVDTLSQLTNGDFAKYLSQKTPAIFKETSANVEKHLVNNVFLPYVIKNNQAINANGSGDQTYCIFAIRWEEGNFSGLFDPNGFSQGSLMQTIPLSGGSAYKNSKGQTVKGADFKSYLGVLTANPRNIAAIVNISKTNPVSADMMDELLESVRAGDSGKTLIYGHPKALNTLKSLKSASLTMSANDKNYSRSISSWDYIPIIPTYNMQASKALKVQ